jgi:hypothetical protein
MVECSNGIHEHRFVAKLMTYYLVDVRLSRIVNCHGAKVLSRPGAYTVT